MAPINSLPPELVSSICTHLKPADLFALRLASRDVSAKCFDHFANRFFASLQLLVTSDNLALLRDIAAHPVFCTRVREVWITPALFEGDYNLSIEDFEQLSDRTLPDLVHFVHESRPPFSNPDTEDALRRRRYKAYKAAVADHLGIATTRVLQRALEDAFKRLPNLKSVGLRHHDPGFSHLGRPYENHGLKCRGWRALHEATGHDPALSWHAAYPLDQGVPIVRARVFSAMLTALATARRNVDSLDTCGGSCAGLILSDFGLSDAQWDTTVCAVADLKALHLCLRDCTSPPASDGTYKSALSILTKSAPNLESLAFSLPFFDKSRHFEWTAQRVRFSRLSSLKLLGISTTPQGLKQFLSSVLPTLRRLELCLVKLTRPDPQGAGAEDADMTGRRVWRDMWDFFRDNMSLEHVGFTSLGGPFGPLRVVDRLHGPRGSDRLISGMNVAYFDATQAKVSFQEWIDQLGFETEEEFFANLDTAA